MMAKQTIKLLEIFNQAFITHSEKSGEPGNPCSEYRLD
jgi:hypothetical protein